MTAELVEEIRAAVTDRPLEATGVTQSRRVAIVPPKVQDTCRTCGNVSIVFLTIIVFVK